MDSSVPLDSEVVELIADTIPVTLLFSDGVAKHVEAHPGESVVNAAQRAGLTILTDCCNGECGTCRAELVSGVLELGPHSDLALSEEDRRDGAVLTCISKVTAPCAVEFPYDATEAMSEEDPPFVGRITRIEQVAAETLTLEVLIDEPLDFEPGQYVRIRPLGAEAWRSYSMANQPGSDTLRFFIRVVDGGVFSMWLKNQAAVGSDVELSGPRGTFFLRREPRPRIFVSGGTGLAPFLSMLRFIASDPSLSRIPTTLLVGVRSGAHFFARDEIEAVQKEIPLLKVVYAAEKNGVQSCRAGYATDLIGEAVEAGAGDRVYLCGPPPMVEAGRKAAQAAGIPNENALAERFI